MTQNIIKIQICIKTSKWLTSKYNILLLQIYDAQNNNFVIVLCQKCDKNVTKISKISPKN